MLEGKMMPRFMLVRPANGKANNQDAESQQKSRKHGEFGLGYVDIMGFPGGAGGKEPACLCKRHKRDTRLIFGWGRSLEEGMVTHSSILAWRIPWAEEPGGLQFRGSQRVRHN